MNPYTARAVVACVACVLSLLPSGVAAQDIDAIIRGLGDKSARVREDAALSVYNANLRARAAVPKLLSMLASERDAEVRLYVVKALGVAGKESPGVPEALAQLLKQDTVAEMRARSAEALGRLGTAADLSVPALVAALADKSDEVRNAAADALGEFPASAGAIVPALVAALADRPVANSALQTLARFGVGAAPALPALRQLVRTAETPSGLRLSALGALGSIGSVAANAAPDFLPLLDDPDPEIRVEAAIALMSIGQYRDRAMRTLVAAQSYDNGRRNLDDAYLRRAVVVRAAWALGNFGVYANGDAVSRLAVNAQDADGDIRAFATKAFDEVLAALVKAQRYDAIDSLVGAKTFLAQSQDEALRARSRSVAATIDKLERLQPVGARMRRFRLPALGASSLIAVALVFLLIRLRSAALRVFISYRRRDSAASCGRLYDWLVSALGVERVFRDIDSLAPGTLFADRLRRSVAECDAFIVLIGPSWLAAEPEGRRRLDDPDDFVRLEIETALRQGKPVFPVLVEGARMPTASELPASVAPIAASNAIEIADRHFTADMRRLLAAMCSVRAAATKSPPAEQSLS